MKEITDKLEFIKIKNCFEKDNVRRMRRQATVWEKIFAKDISDKGLLSKINKETEDLQGGGGVRHGDHFPPHKYIKNTSTCGTTPTEHLLKAGRRPQTSQKSHVSHRVLVLWPGVRPESLT